MRHPRKRVKISNKIHEKIYNSWMDHLVPGGYYDNVRISKTIKKVLKKETHGGYDERLIDKHLKRFRKEWQKFRDVRWYRLLLR